MKASAEDGMEEIDKASIFIIDYDLLSSQEEGEEKNDRIFYRFTNR